jgi:hypothetical protein
MRASEIIPPMIGSTAALVKRGSLLEEQTWRARNVLGPALITDRCKNSGIETVDGPGKTAGQRRCELSGLFHSLLRPRQLATTVEMHKKELALTLDNVRRLKYRAPVLIGATLSNASQPHSVRSS